MTRRHPALWLTKPVRRRHPERDEQAHIVRLLRTVGGETWPLGTTRRWLVTCPHCHQPFNLPRSHMGTQQGKGVADLLAVLPPARSNPAAASVFLVVEVKALGGRLRPDQVRFRDCCLAAGIAHVTGGVDAVIAWLLEHHYLARDQVAHYRLPLEDPDAVSQP